MTSYKSLFVTAAGIALWVLGPGVPASDAADPKAAPIDSTFIEEIVRDYLLKNPKVVVDALNAYKLKQARLEEKSIQHIIRARRDELQNDPNSAVGGNINGDVTVVEFFDYRCGVCKRAHLVVAKLIKQDQKIRYVYKEWPILGQQSVFAARAAIASRQQGDNKYLAFHNRMMETTEILNPRKVIEIASDIGLNIKKLRADMKAAEIGNIIQDNYRLAKALKLNGTPSFLIGDTLLRGVRDIDTMISIVRIARKKS